MLKSYHFIYFSRLINRNSKPKFYFSTLFIGCIFLVVMLVLVKRLNNQRFYVHELLITSSCFQCFYNFFYYGLGWHSSYKYFVTHYLKLKDFIWAHTFINSLCFIFSLALLKFISYFTWPIISYSILNILIVYLVIPNLLFFFIFPRLTIYISLFSNKGLLVVHRYYAFPLLGIAVAIPAILQHLWLNFTHAPELITVTTIFCSLIVVFKFQQIVKSWENRLLQTNAE